ncbi:hypothetical protein LTR10_013995 [Elasticomyces elasticus]|nr:hypothetical protein LTR10_013995 [Elasticomyces elasticus]
MAQFFAVTDSGFRSVWVHGLGGVGKTQLCLEYLHEHAQKHDAVFWISADDKIKMGQDVRNALAKLGLIARTASETDQQCQTIFKGWLTDRDVSWLLVLDNADDVSVLQNFWPTNPSGRCIVTSRDPTLPRYLSTSRSTKSLAVLPLSEHQGAGLMLNILNAPDGLAPEHNQLLNTVPEDLELAKLLSKELGGLPLAIDQIANYARVVKCSLGDVSQIYADFKERSLLWQQDTSGDLTGHVRSLDTVWEMSISRIAKANPDATHLLQLLCMYDCDGVPQTLIDGTDEQRPGSNTPQLLFLRKKVQLLSATGALLRQSMINKDKAGSRISMHRLVAAITRQHMSHEDHQARFDEALELLFRVYPQMTPERVGLNDQWPRCRLYLPQVIALKHIYRESASPIIPRAHFAVVLANACWFLFEQGHLEEVMKLLPTATEVAEATSGNDDFAHSTVYRSLGGIQLDVGEPQEALRSFSRALALQRNVSEVVSAHGYTAVALAYLCQEDYDNAKKNLDTAQEIRSRHPGQSEGYRAMTLDVLGMLDSLRGRYQSALQYLEDAIALYDEDQGPGNYLTAFANFTRGNIYEKTGDLEEAFRQHTLSLTVRRDSLGETYRTAASLHKVGYLLHMRHDEAGAEDLLLKALAIYENSYKGEGAVGRSSYLMSIVLSANGREDDARNTKALASGIRQKILGIPPDQEDTLESYDRLVGYQDR